MKVWIDLPDWARVGPICSSCTKTFVWPGIGDYEGIAGLYLIDAFSPGHDRHDWYIGQSGNLECRFKSYRSAKPNPGSAATTTRVAGKIHECLKEGGKAELSVLLAAKLTLPDRYTDEAGNSLEWEDNLKDPATRLLIESAALVHRIESMHGAWEKPLNRPRGHKGTVSGSSPLDDLVIEFLPDP